MAYISLGQRDKLPAINVVFDKPRHGYWDGGAKSGGYFHPEELYPKTKTEGKCVKWGCWDLNFYFTTGFGVSWKHAASIARRKLQHMLGVPATVTVEQ
jgi:hypothetical protein